MMSDDPTSADPTIEVTKRQLVLLGKLAEIAMSAARAFGSSAVVSVEAEKRILADENFIPEVGRARACGAKDAAESLQKVRTAAAARLRIPLVAGARSLNVVTAAAMALGEALRQTRAFPTG